MNPGGALVLFSGGQDSATCLAWALARYERVETIGFDYGQRHRIELECRVKVLAQLRRAFPDWATRLGDDHVLDLPVLGRISATSLTQDTAFRMTASSGSSTRAASRSSTSMPTTGSCRCNANRVPTRHTWSWA